MIELPELCVRRSIKVQVVKTLKRVKQQTCFPHDLFSFRKRTFKHSQ